MASIVRLAALEIDGVESVGSAGLSESITEYFKGKDSGVRVSEDEAEDYQIEIKVILRFGVELAKTAVRIQQNIRDQVTRMTMKSVSKVDVIIDGVRLPKDEEQEDGEEAFIHHAND